VHDDPQQIERARLAIKDGRLCDEFIPYPFERKADGSMCDSEYDSKGYDWCVENWGTKWDICDAKLQPADKNLLDAFFLSAWGPPIEVMRALEAAGFRVILKYVEYGMAFEGIYRDGHDDTWELDFEEDIESEEEVDYLEIHRRLYPSEASLDHLFVQPLSELDFWVIEPDPLATPLVPALFFVMNPEMPAPVSPLPVPQWIDSDANLICKLD
jgi:hypothetical protein